MPSERSHTGGSGCASSGELPVAGLADEITTPGEGQVRGGNAAFNAVPLRVEAA
jgi:hypothetical protein